MSTRRWGLMLAAAGLGALYVGFPAYAGTRTEPPLRPTPIQWGQLKMARDGGCEASIAGSRDWKASGACVIEFAPGINTATSAFLFSSSDTLGTARVKVDRGGHVVTIKAEGSAIATLDFTLIHY